MQVKYILRNFAPRNYKWLSMDIKSVIKKYGVSQDDIAERMGCSKGYISQLANLKSEPTLRKLQELADAIGCKRWEFFKDEMEEEKDVVESHQTTPAPPAQEGKSAPGMFICPHCGKGVSIRVE